MGKIKETFKAMWVLKFHIKKECKEKKYLGEKRWKIFNEPPPPPSGVREGGFWLFFVREFVKMKKIVREFEKRMSFVIREKEYIVREFVKFYIFVRESWYIRDSWFSKWLKIGRYKPLLLLNFNKITVLI